METIYKTFYSHAPHGARLCLVFVSKSQAYFYSHAPRGARLGSISYDWIVYGFLLTRPSRGATALGFLVL